jgi:hypothetical protein
MALFTRKKVPPHAVAIEPMSPAAVSAKREYLRVQLETFRLSAA